MKTDFNKFKIQNSNNLIGGTIPYATSYLVDECTQKNDTWYDNDGDGKISAGDRICQREDTNPCLREI